MDKVLGVGVYFLRMPCVCPLTCVDDLKASCFRSNAPSIHLSLHPHKWTVWLLLHDSMRQLAEEWVNNWRHKWLCQERTPLLLFLSQREFQRAFLCVRDTWAWAPKMLTPCPEPGSEIQFFPTLIAKLVMDEMLWNVMWALLERQQLMLTWSASRKRAKAVSYPLGLSLPLLVSSIPPPIQLWHPSLFTSRKTTAASHILPLWCSPKFHSYRNLSATKHVKFLTALSTRMGQYFIVCPYVW